MKNIITRTATPVRHARHIRLSGLIMAGVLTLSGARPAYAEESRIQSGARPFGLNIVAPVYESGSDKSAASFMEYYSKTLVPWINANLPEYRNNYSSSIRLDPSQLSLSTASDVRVYFVGEGAGYNNTLGFTTNGGKITTGNPLLIFPNATTNPSYNNAPNLSNASPNKNFPWIPGDFVDLGTMAAGTQLDFFLIANGASGATDNIFSTDATVNRDGLKHTIAYAPNGSPYLLIGFEDLFGGGDKDYNDLLFAVAVAPLTSAPEPSTTLILGSFLLVVIYFKSRQQKPVLKGLHV